MEEREDSFAVLDADGRPLYQVFFRRSYHKPDALDRMTRDEALKVVQPLLRLPDLLRIEKMTKAGDRT